DFLFYNRPIGHSHGISPTWQETSEDCPAFAADAFESLEFGEWFRMVVHAQVEVGPLVFAINDQTGSLFAALAPACRLASAHRRDQSTRKGDRLAGNEGFHGRVEDLSTGKHVAGNRKSVAGQMPVPINAGGTRVRRAESTCVHDVHLPLITPRVMSDQGIDGRVRGRPGVKELKAFATVKRVDQRLCCDGAHACGYERYPCSDCEEFCCDSDPKGAGGFVTGNDRPGHSMRLR